MSTPKAFMAFLIASQFAMLAVEVAFDGGFLILLVLANLAVTVIASIPVWVYET